MLALFFLCQLFPSIVWSLVFPFHLLAKKDATQHWHYILSPSVAVMVDIALWSFVMVAFARFIGRFGVGVGIGYLVPLVFATVALVGIAVQFFVRWLGMDFYWDLWH